MATAAITMNEMEWRSYAIMADAGHVISRIAKRPRVAHAHWSLLMNLGSCNEKIVDLLRLFHAPDSIETLELATPEQLTSLALKLRNVHEKIQQVINQFQAANLGNWRRAYQPKLAKLEQYDREISSHVDAFSQNESSLILLSRRDQEYLLESLLKPPEPNESLRRAFARK